MDWIGTSMGGIIGMMIAALPNSPIRKLVLNDIGPQIPIKGLRRLGKYAGINPIFDSMNDAKQYCKRSYADFGNLSEEQWDKFTENSIKQITNGYTFKVDPGIRTPKSLSQWLKELLRHPAKALEGILYDIDLWDTWTKIQCPILVIHGKRSDILTSDIIEKMRQTHPNTEVHEIEDAGHAPALLDIKTHKTIYNWLAK
jgi:pimeloyl-ACP methyl ester carboxylesterase